MTYIPLENYRSGFRLLSDVKTRYALSCYNTGSLKQMAYVRIVGHICYLHIEKNMI